MSTDNIIHVDFSSRSIRDRQDRRPSPQFVPVRAPEDTAESVRDSERDPLGDLYSLRDAAKLFHLPESRLRYWERQGFIVRSCELSGRRYYTFQDLIGIRAARELLDEGVSLRCVSLCRASRVRSPRCASWRTVRTSWCATIKAPTIR